MAVEDTGRSRFGRDLNVLLRRPVRVESVSVLRYASHGNLSVKENQMIYRSFTVVFVVMMVMALMPMFVSAQVTNEPLPRTVWGQPDLGGVWEFKTRTRLQRPERYGDREFLTTEEADQIERSQLEQTQEYESRPAQRTEVIPGASSRPGKWLDQPDHESLKGQPGSYNYFWFDWGTKAVGTRRTSLVVDPPNGRLPAKTEAGRQRGARMSASSSFSDTAADSHLDLSNSDRCLMSGNAGPPMLPGVYNNNMQLFQTPDYVAILVEMIHTVRIIPLDGRPGLSADVRQFTGDSRGYWEGDTLVVETENFNDDTAYLTWRSTSQNMTLVERFTRVDADTLEYRFTVTDPDTWESSWTAELPMVRSDLAVYEFACHEGNYGLPNILAGNRIQEAAADDVTQESR